MNERFWTAGLAWMLSLFLLIIPAQAGDGKPAYISLTANPTQLPSDGLSSSIITARVYDSTGEPATGSVSFSTTLGTISKTPVTIYTYTADPVDPDDPDEEPVTVSTGTAITSLIAGMEGGMAKVTASIGGITQAVSVQIGTLPAKFVSLSANPYLIYANGFSTSTITASLTDELGQPVPAGTKAYFYTNLGRFSNGLMEIEGETLDATGTLSVTLFSGTQTGIATVTCYASETIYAQVQVKFAVLRYESETNNEMEEADVFQYDDAFQGQLASPYDVDWYVFQINQTSHISLNFITTAIPEGAGCEDSSTVGTYRIDIRDKDNNVLMSYQNVDCSLDNGIWETGLENPGTYYIVVYCPRVPDNSHYLSTPYYITAFITYDPPCVPDIKANAQDGPLSISSDTMVSLTLSLSPGTLNEHSADWWVVWVSPWGYISLSYLGWIYGVAPLAQYPLFYLPVTEILYQTLPVGDHAFFFCLDTNPDWLLGAPFYFDYVQVQVTP